MSKTKKTSAKASISKTTNKRSKKMEENFVIGSRDARQVSGQLKKAVKAKKAVAAVKAVAGVEAIKAVPSKTVKGITQPAVKAVKGIEAVKAIAAQLAVPAQPAVYSMKIGCNSKAIAVELIKRMADQKIMQKPDTEIFEDIGIFYIWFTAPEQKIRAALKKAKSKDSYNAPGLALLAGKKKKEDDAKAAKEAKEKKSEKKEEKKEPLKEEGADWPTE